MIVGLIGAMLMAGLGYINDWVFGLDSMTAGHQLPVSVMGLFIVAMIVINPLLGRLGRRWALRPAEVGFAMMLLMVSCSIPGRGLMEQFTEALGMPAHWNRMESWMRKNRLLEYVPPFMLPAGGQYDDRVTEGFLTGGLGRPGRPIGLDRVPWDKWRTPLLAWCPLIFLTTAASICLGLIVHRQWSSHERLQYPIAQFTRSLIEAGTSASANRTGPPRWWGDLFRNKLFWVGLGIVLAIRIINGLNVWYPENMIQIPMTYDLSPLRQIWPTVAKTFTIAHLLRPQIYPIVIAFCFFLSSEISLTLGLSLVLYAPIAVTLIVRGVDTSTDYEIGGIEGWQRAGSYVALGIALFYIGRRYYIDVLKQAITFRPQPGVESYAAWACRFLLLTTAAIITVVACMGLDWPIAIMTVLLMMLTFLCVSRISAETGLFFIQPGWQPYGFILALLGPFALGPQALILSAMVCSVLCIDQSMAVMPYFTNGLKVCGDLRVGAGRSGWSGMGVFVIGVCVAVPVVLWANYNYGVPQRGYNWWYAYYRIPTVPFRAADPMVTNLKLSNRLEESQNLTPLERLANIQPAPRFVWSAGAGFAAVLLFMFLRLRFTWWPLHPVMFLVWTTWPIQMFGASFFLGWILKTVVTRFGGTRLYRQCKPMMIGVVAAELLAGLIFMIHGGLYYAVTGLLPKEYRFFPR